MSERGDGIESLIDAVIDGRCDEDGLRRFERLVRDDPRAREAYLEQIRMHALLEWRHGRVELDLGRASPPATRRRGPVGLWWGLAAMLLIGAGVLLQAYRGVRPGPVREG